VPSGDDIGAPDAAILALADTDAPSLIKRGRLAGAARRLGTAPAPTPTPNGTECMRYRALRRDGGASLPSSPRRESKQFVLMAVC